MFKNKSFLAIIPARSGSKGLIDKNIKIINGKPLMAYTIEACKNSNIFDDIIVSTDSEKYAQIARDYGASVPFLRPTNLSLDVTSTMDVILHILSEMQRIGKQFDYFMLLQPTSPLRNEIHITESINILLQQSADSVVSICPLEHGSHLNVAIDEFGQLKLPFQNKGQTRRQEMSKEYRLNGAIYLAETRFFLSQKSFYGGRTFPLIMDVLHSIDIDEDYDFKLAEYIMKLENSQK